VAIQGGAAPAADSSLKRVHIFVMSPADVNAEREIVEEIVRELDRSIGDEWGMALRTLRWETQTGDVGPTAQEITNEAYLKEPCQIYVGIMWRKLGSPTGNVDPSGRPYQSGTLEEFERVLEFKRRSGGKWPRILFYRCVAGGMPTTPEEINQLGQVAAFFQQFDGQGEHPGRYFQYKTRQKFRTRLQTDLLTVLKELRKELDGERSDPSRASATAAPDDPAGQGPAIPAGWETKYLTALREELERIPIRVPGAGRGAGRGHCPLGTVYVPLDLHCTFDLPAGQIDWTRMRIPKLVVVTGDAGSGKSTLLRWAALAVINARLGKSSGDSTGRPDGTGEPRGGSKLPIWLDLVDVASRFGRGAGGADDAADYERWLPVLATATSLTESQVRELLRLGDVVVFLDKLDEVPDPDQRDMLARSVKRMQVQSSPLGAPNHVIMACRSRGLDGATWAADFDEIRIRAMDSSTRDHYLRAWCGVIWGAKAAPSLQSVLDAVRRSPALAELAAIPQVATMLARIAADGPLPMQRVELYDQFVSTMIATVRLRSHGPEKIRGHLVALAHAMQINAEPGVLGVASARDVLEARGGSPALLEDLELHTGLITVDRKGPASDLGAVVRFEHRTLQEFLAACHFAEHPDALLEKVLDSAWTETLAMTAGVLALERPSQLREFLAAVVREPVFTPATSDELALVDWAPRVAVASICLTEIASFGVTESLLEPARSAQNRLLPALQSLEMRTRVSVADGLGSVRDPRLSPEARWVDIPAGPFWRGSDDPDAWEQEKPPCLVEVTSFRIQRWPVTVAEFRQFMQAGQGYARPAWWPPEGWEWRLRQQVDTPSGWEHQEPRLNRPVTGVCWWEATAYCAWLAAEGDVPSGWRAVLPTEAQWEKAARGPADGVHPRQRFPWGDAWADDRHGPANFRNTRTGICPVGLFAPDQSPYGAWDFAGNVAERCLDGFAAYQPEPGPDPVCRDYAHGHAVRGGSWASYPLDLRVTVRFGDSRDSRDDRTGFRVVLIPVEPA